MIPVIVARMIGIAATSQLNITAVLLPEPSESIRSKAAAKAIDEYIQSK